MSGGEVARVAGSIFQLADILQRLGNSYYKASAAWKEFPVKVHLLRAKYDDLETQLERFGQSPTPPLLMALKAAKALMDVEVTALEERVEGRGARDGRNCGIMLCARRLGEMVFPEQVGLAIQTAMQALDGVVNHFKEVRENEETLRSAALTRCDSLSSGDDSEDCYVPLERTELMILSSLRESTAASPKVVLVYGGPGRGKSTVARQIRLILGADKSSFARVVLLECGLGADSESRQMELLQKLGGSTGDYLPTMPGSQANDKSGSTFLRKSLLKAFLKKKKLLIVLDDVWESRFLQSFLKLSGDAVKYLVTSQQENLCKDLTCKYVTIQIEDLERADARKILAVHVGYQNKLIPDHFEVMAEKILSQAGGIPLVIAQLGAQIGKAESNQLGVWESVADDFFRCLDETPSKYVFGTRYPRSWWAAVQQSCDASSHKAKQLLILLAMCKGPWIPESVLQFLYSAVFPTEGCTKYQFSQMKMELKSRQLVSVKDEKWLSLHSLTREFILEKMDDAVKLIEGRLHGQGSDKQQNPFHTMTRENRVTIVLTCLYLDPDFGQRVVLQTSYPSHAFSELRRAIVEPIVQFLVPETMFGAHYKATEFRASAIQVLLAFICNNTLLHDQISELLGCGTWIIPTLKFLEKLYFLGESFWQTNTLHKLSCKLVHVLQDNADSNLLIQAQRTLLQLCLCRGPNVDDVISTPEMLQLLSESLCQDQNPHLQRTAAGTIALLVYGEGRILIKHKILNAPMVVDNLVHSLAKDHDFALQNEAARALRNLTDTEDTNILDTMANVPDFLHRLGNSLAKGDNPLLQEHAAGIFGNLSQGANRARNSKAIHLPGLVEFLVEHTIQNQNLGLQKCAARVLGRLASTENISIPDVLLDTLGESLMATHNHGLQEQAAAVLAELARGKGVALKGKIMHFPNMLEKLIHSTALDHNSCLQVEATLALQHLASSHDTTILDKMVSFPNLLQRLGESLTNNNNPLLQQHAANTIAHLGWGNLVCKNKISHFPGLWEKLIQSTTQDQNSGLQKAAAFALGMLASTTMRDITFVDPFLSRWRESLMPRHHHPLQQQPKKVLADFDQSGQDVLHDHILDLPDLVIKLQSKAHDHEFDLQLQAAKALLQLASSRKTSILEKIISFPHLLDRLGEMLTNQQDPLLQVKAAATLANLSTGQHNAHQCKVLQLPGILDSLVQSTMQDQNLDLQQHAAHALGNLAASNAWDTTVLDPLLCKLGEALDMQQDQGSQEQAALVLFKLSIGRNGLQSKIISFPDLLQRLVQCLAQDHNVGLQVGAAAALGNLATTDETKALDEMVNFPELLCRLGNLLAKEKNHLLQVNAVATLANLSRGKHNARKYKVLNLPGILDRLVQSTMQDQNLDLQQHAARALGNLAGSNAWDTTVLDPLLCRLGEALDMQQDQGSQEQAALVLSKLSIANNGLRRKIIFFPNLLQRLVQCLAQDHHVGLQVQAAMTLWSLATTDETKALDEMVNFPEFLCRLGNLLAKEKNHLLQVNAAGTLASLSRGKHNARKYKVLNLPGILDRLVQCTMQDQNLNLQQHAARALGNLAGSNAWDTTVLDPLLCKLGEALDMQQDQGSQEQAALVLSKLSIANNGLRRKIISFPDLLQRLVQCLAQDHDVSLQVGAAAALGNLATTDETKALDEMVNFPELLCRLGNLLAKEKNRLLQVNAARILANLSSGKHNTCKYKVLNLPGILDRLVQSTMQDQNLDLQQHAARALGSLAGSNAWDTTVLDPLLCRLGEALDMQQDQGSQEQAALVLSNLSIGSNGFKSKIIFFPNLLQRLVQCLAQDHHVGLQVQAAATLWNLAATNETKALDEMVNFPELLCRLGNLLAKEKNHRPQVNAVATLANLSRGKHNARKYKVLNLLGILDRLVQSTMQDQNLDLQQHAARALGNLAGSNAWDTTDLNPLLCRLGEALDMQQDQDSQEQAALVLSNLTIGSNGFKSKIIFFPNLLQRLVQCLAQDHHVGLQVQAATTLWSLAATDETKALDEMVNFPELLCRLGNLLAKEKNHLLQVNAAATLANLSSGKHNACKYKVLNLPGILDRLVQSTMQDQNLDLQQHAARALGSLAGSNAWDTTVLDPLLCRLGEALDMQQDQGSQEQAAPVLSKLSIANNGLRRKIIFFPDLLQRLVQCLAQDHNVGLQVGAAAALRNLATTDETKALDEMVNFPELLCRLGNLLAKEKNHLLQVNAAATLANLSCGKHNACKYKVLNLPGILDRLVQSTMQDQNLDLQQHAARALGSLAGSNAWDTTVLDPLLCRLGEALDMQQDQGSQEQAALVLSKLSIANNGLRRKIIFFPDLLQRLVQCLAQDHNVSLQVGAAAALRNLATTDETKALDEMVNFPELLCRLGNLLAKEKNHLLQVNAAATLANLSCGKHNACKYKVLNLPGILDRLVQSTMQDQNLDLQQHAACALGSLAGSNAWDTTVLDPLLCRLGEALDMQQDQGSQEQAALILSKLSIANNGLRRKIIFFPNLLQRLVQCLAQDHNVGLQVGAAAALRNLATTDETKALDEMVNFPELLCRLGNLLAKEKNHLLQVNAAATLANLSSGKHNACKYKVLNLPGILDRLVQSTMQDQNLDLQQHAARALGSLAGSNAWDTTVLDPLLCRLGEALDMQQDQGSQEQAALVLSKLSIANNGLRRKIIFFPNLLQRLVQCLAQDHNVGLQVGAAAALRNLATTDETKALDEMVNFPELLCRLGNLLAKEKNHLLQVNAAATLANLSSGKHNACKYKVLNLAGILDRLVQSTMQDQNLDLQQHAAHALGNLAGSNAWDTTVLDPLLCRLGEALDMQQDQGSQEQAALVLSKLSIANNGLRRKIIFFPDLLQRLVQCLAQDHNVGLQVGAAAALRNLATTDETKALNEMVNFPELLCRLGDLLAKEKNHLLQVNAAATLANLSSGKHNACKYKVLNLPGILDRLVQSTMQDQNLDLQQHAARALGSLAGSNAWDTTVLDPLLCRLGEALDMQQDQGSQEQAALVLSKLSIANNGLRRKIIFFPNLLQRLVQCLAQDHNVGLQVGAAAALRNLATTDETKALDEMVNFPELLCRLGNLLAKEKNHLLQVNAAATLANLSSGKHNACKYKVLNLPGILDRLVQSTMQDQNLDLQQHAARALGSLAGSNAWDTTVLDPLLCRLGEALDMQQDQGSQEQAALVLSKLSIANNGLRRKIIFFPNLLQRLVQCLAQDHNVGLQVGAAAALRNLATTDETKALDEMVNFPELLCRLGNLLAKEKNHLLQVDAAATLANLSSRKHNACKYKVLNLPGILDRLVQSTMQDQNLDLQQHAARALGSLAGSNAWDTTVLDPLLCRLGEALDMQQDQGSQEQAALVLSKLSIANNGLRRKIIFFPDLLQRLVQCLAQDHNVGLQVGAAAALWNLATTDETKALDEMVNFPEFLCRLGNLLAKEKNHLLQVNAAGTLANLSRGKHNARMYKVLNLPGILDRLVQCTMQDQNLDLQQHAARALGNLAGSNAWDTTVLDPLLCKLGEALDMQQDQGSQEQAALALCNLSMGSNGLESKIIFFPNLLQRLVYSLAEDCSANLQVEVARCLWSLAATDETKVLDEMANFPGFLCRLGDLLIKENKPLLQESAAATLADLSSGKHKARKYKVLNLPEILDRLVQSVMQDENFELQRYAASALGNLANASSYNIIVLDVLLHRVGELLTIEHSHDCQEQAAAVVANLGILSDVVKSKIVHFPKLFGQLVYTIGQDDKVDLQVEATRAVRNLAFTQNNAILVEMANFPNLLCRLGEVLARDRIPLLQEHAACAIAWLGREQDEAGKRNIVSIPRLLERLVECAEQEENFDLKKQAVGALGSLASAYNTAILDTLLHKWGDLLMAKHKPGLQERTTIVLGFLGKTKDMAIKRKIVFYPKCLEKLVNCIHQDHNLDFHEEVAEVLRGLAATEDTTILDKMVNFPNLLNRLGEALKNETRPTLQEYAAWAIANLARVADRTLWDEIIDFPWLLDKVVHLIPSTLNLDFDEDNARALGNLASVGDDMVKDRIASSPELLGWLIESLAEGSNPYLQKVAAWAVASLASAKDKRIRDKMASFPSLLENLVQMLDEDQNHGLQTQAAWALSRLPHAKYTDIDDKITSLLVVT